MKNLISTIVLISGLFNHLIAQSDEFVFSMYYGNYSMEGLKKIHNQFNEDLPSILVDDFPNYWGYEVGYGFGLNGKSMLIFYGGLISTAGKSNYTDYSGIIDMQTNLWSLYSGLEYQIKVNNSDKWDLNLGLRLGPTFSHLDFVTKIEIGRESISNEKYKFNSINIHFSPSLTIRKDLRGLILKTFVRYELEKKGKLNYSEDKDLYLINEGSPVHAEWSGFRTGLSIGFKL